MKWCNCTIYRGATKRLSQARPKVSGIDSGGAGGARESMEFWGSEKGGVWFLLKYQSLADYYERTWISKAIYGAESKKSPLEVKVFAPYSHKI